MVDNDMDTKQVSYTIRPAEPKDETYVRTLMEVGGMGLAPDWQDAIVAANGVDAPIGYLRVQQTDKGPHVAPVAVYPYWQGCGIGRALMEHAVQQHGYLKLVARGEVADFYRKLGCREITLDQISGDLEEDCAHCADFDTCRPVPFIIGTEPSL